MRCLCVNCLNEKRLDMANIIEYPSCNGFIKNYTTWTWHGELLGIPSVSKTHEFVVWTIDDKLENMIRDVRIQSFIEALYENISTNTEILLYFGSIDFT